MLCRTTVKHLAFLHSALYEIEGFEKNKLSGLANTVRLF